MNTLNNLPPDIKNVIYSHFNNPEFDTLRCVSKGIKDEVDQYDAAKIGKKIQFKDRFGALSDEENSSTSSINALGNHMHFIRKLKSSKYVKWTAAAAMILTFKNGQPQLIPYSSYFKEEDSWWETLKKKYDLFRGETTVEVRPEILKIFENHVKAVQEFLDKPYDSNHPVQDLRDRMIRIECIEGERELLLNAFNQPCENLTLIEKIIFSVISFFHSLWQPTVAQHIEKLGLPVKAGELIDKKGCVHLGTTDISLNGEKIPLNIVVRPYRCYGEYYPYHSVSLERADTNERMGYMIIKQSWKENGSGRYYESVLGEPVGKLSDPYLFIDEIRTNGLQDQTSGDLPVLRTLTQLAIEIAEREPVQAIVMDSAYAHSDVYSTAGFYSQHESSYKLEDIRKEVLQERAQNKKLYPDCHHDHSAFSVHLDKSKFSEVHGTKYFRENEEGKQPAYVEFDLDGTKRTWEQQIAQHPILQPGTGPVLWRFWKRDLAKEAEKQ